MSGKCHYRIQNTPFGVFNIEKLGKPPKVRLAQEDQQENFRKHVLWANRAPDISRRTIRPELGGNGE